ncbi:MAG: ATP-dependent DNA ligase, partial [Flavobacteriales bacterium]|nr:ATP-dependent DNA ligase [Flavobacteriales bacterium]
MKRFAEMFEQVDGSTKTTVKVNALAEYFKEATDEDKVWAIAIMSHRRPKRPMTTTVLREWASESSGIPLWLFEESYHIAGDLAETIALLCHGTSKANSQEVHSLSDYIHKIIRMKGLTESEQKAMVQEIWKSLDLTSCFLFNKLLTGNIRMGVSRKLMTRALSKATQIEENIIAHKIMGDWDPQKISFQELILDIKPENISSRPYPFYLAYSIKDNAEELGDPDHWQVEWKWDGIRGQVIARKNHLYIWTRGEELVTDRYPELEVLKDKLPQGTVLDGEILAFKDGLPLDFKALQKRLGRKTTSKKILEEVPVVFMAYDILEYEGEDIRQLSMSERRRILEDIYAKAEISSLLLSPIVEFRSWEELEALLSSSREKRCEGFMLKRKDSAYEVGRKKGAWWKWKIDPFTIDAVLTFAMRGHGRRSNLYTDYTFGLWKGDELVTFAKAYSGLTDKQFAQIDQFVRKNSIQRFGPVRQVEPKLVFEIAFEGIARSTRHKSGVAVRFPRMLRWREDKKAEEANT